ncbi:MAG: alpha/beta hydrolase [Planctomycetes bacterium]|nr:alpha/beta hydrolase [Planctomycetota bacterium]
MTLRRLALIPVTVCLLTFPDYTRADEPYEQHENVTYAEVHGVGLLLDTFVPSGQKNGRAIIDVASGAWHSDRGKIRDHERAQVYRIMCEKGFTVFAVRPGSITKFSAREMVDHVNTAIRWVKEQAGQYDIDANQLGLMGASAGGHLASLAAVAADDSTRVKAVAVFFPPTDFLDYGGTRLDRSGEEGMGRIVRALALPAGESDGRTQEEITEALEAISPARLVTSDAPPFLLIHGDADPAVPLQQSEVMVAALKAKGVSAELVVKPGGTHPWPTIHEEVAVMADWFVKQLVDE